MDTMLKQIRDLISTTNSDDRWGKLLIVTYAFCWFGKIHPFLDGNGHERKSRPLFHGPLWPR
jgi:Fic family protein